MANPQGKVEGENILAEMDYNEAEKENVNLNQMAARVNASPI